MDDRQRAEQAREIERKVREGVPFDRIFPTKVWTPQVPVPFADGSMEFVAAERPSPHDGTPTRYYRLECQHLASELHLADMHPDQDGEVLGNMISTAKARIANEGGLCLCWPKGWRAA